MDVTPLIPKGNQLIESYGEGGFHVTGTRYEGSVLVFAGHTQPWSVTALENATEADFSPILGMEPAPEMVVVGCGEAFGMLPKGLRQAFRRKGIPVEAMDTGAACRTYNVLMTEGRRVVAALIAV